MPCASYWTCYDRGNKIKDLYSVIGETIFSKYGRDQGNAKITGVKNTENEDETKTRYIEMPLGRVQLCGKVLEGGTS